MSANNYLSVEQTGKGYEVTPCDADTGKPMGVTKVFAAVTPMLGYCWSVQCEFEYGVILGDSFKKNAPRDEVEPQS